MEDDLIFLNDRQPFFSQQKILKNYKNIMQPETLQIKTMVVAPPWVTKWRCTVLLYISNRFIVFEELHFLFLFSFLFFFSFCYKKQLYCSYNIKPKWIRLNAHKNTHLEFSDFCTKLIFTRELCKNVLVHFLVFNYSVSLVFSFAMAFQIT